MKLFKPFPDTLYLVKEKSQGLDKLYHKAAYKLFRSTVFGRSCETDGV